MARELCIDLTIVAIVASSIVATALTTWWSAYCLRRFCRR